MKHQSIDYCLAKDFILLAWVLSMYASWAFVFLFPSPSQPSIELVLWGLSASFQSFTQRKSSVLYSTQHLYFLVRLYVVLPHSIFWANLRTYHHFSSFCVICSTLIATQIISQVISGTFITIFLTKAVFWFQARIFLWGYFSQHRNKKSRSSRPLWHTRNHSSS